MYILYMQVSKETFKRFFKHAINLLKKAVHHLKFSHYVIIVLILGLGIFNAVTALSPYMKQHKREANIEKTFNQWWVDAGEEQFRSVGILPSKKIKADEFARYREKYLAQNPSLIPETRIKQLKAEYKEWWDYNGGRDQFFQETGRFPTPKDYDKLEDKYVSKYTSQILRYNMALVPKKDNLETLATSWILSPSVISFLIFAGFFIFAFLQLESRWRFTLFMGAFVITIAAGGLLIYALASTSFFNHYAGERYMGLSLPLAFMLGAAAFGPKRLEITQLVKGIAIGGTLLDMIINWTVNPDIFGEATVLAPIMFGLGATAGLKIETRKKTKEEIARAALEEKLRNNANRNPMAERKAKTRASIEEGFKAAKEGLMENAQRILGQAFNNLLQEHPIDIVLVKNLTERLTGSDCFVDFTSNQWLEWGEIAKTKNAPEAAILLLKKGLSLEQNQNFARRALYTLGVICVSNGIELSEGVKRLKKVIEMNENDMMAKQARRMLEIADAKAASSSNEAEPPKAQTE